MKAEIVAVFCLVMGGIAFIIIRGPTYSNPKVNADLHACVMVSTCHWDVYGNLRLPILA